jgi:hypothetical protein
MECGWLADCAPGRFPKITGTKAPIAAGVSSYFKQEIQQNLSYTPPREGGGTLKELRLGNRWRKAQSEELTRGPPEIVQHIHLYGEFTSAQERCMS